MDKWLGQQSLARHFARRVQSLTPMLAVVRSAQTRIQRARVSMLFWVATAMLAAFVACAVLTPALVPYNPTFLGGQPLTLPSATHLLGTNDLGQDVLSQVIYGARSSLTVAFSVAAISTVLSWVVGLCAGFARWSEGPLMGLTDLLLALPDIPLYLLVVTLAGAGQRNLILTLALVSWPSFARVVRGVVIQARSSPYVEASRALGATTTHLLMRHLLPVTLDVLPTKLILTVRFAVFTQATLAFLGLADSGSISWGTMLSRAFNDPLLFTRPVWPWLVLPPSLAIVMLILATTWVSSEIERLLAAGPASTVQRKG